jgi:hypothetical protein
MKSIFLLLLTAISLFCQAQNTSWLKSYTGTVGKTAFTMHLHKAGNDYNAFVYYNSVEQPYELSGLVQKTTTITLTGAPNNLSIEKWVIKITNNKLTGSFTLNKKNQPINAIERNFETGINYIYTQKTEKLNTASGAPTATYFASGVWYNNNTIKNKLLWPNCNSNSLGTYFLEDRNKFFANYKEDNKDVKPSDYKENAYMYSSESTSRTLMNYVSMNLLGFTTSVYEFAGGAHGNYNTTHLVIDMRNEQKLELTDLITDTAALAPIIEKNFRKQYKLTPNASLTDVGLFENQIHANNNFFLTQNCLGFTYNPYEIGPYAAGQFTVYIPYSDFKNLIHENAKTIFNDAL